MRITKYKKEKKIKFISEHFDRKTKRKSECNLSSRSVKNVGRVTKFKKNPNVLLFKLFFLC